MIFEKNITISDLEDALTNIKDDEEVVISNLKTSDFAPGVLVSLLQFLITLHRRNRGHNIGFSFATNPFTNTSEYFRSCLHFYAWSFFSGESRVVNSEDPWVSQAFSNQIAIFKKVEELLTRYNLDLQKILDSESSNEDTIEQFRTKHSIKGSRPEEKQHLLKQTEAKEYYRALFSDRSEARKDMEITFFQLNADHIPELNKSQYFYSNDVVKKYAEFKYWIEKLMKFYFRFSGDKKTNNKVKLNKSKTTQEVSRILYELIQNTDEWAKKKFDSKDLYEANLRGVYIKTNSLTSVINTTGPELMGDRLSSYFHQLTIQPHFQSSLLDETKVDPSKIIVVEISVIDAGPGFARRWTGKDYSELTYEEEQKAVHECFIKNFTTDTTSISNLKGKGLSRILNIIGKNGFLKVRTGRIASYRNFLDHPFTEKEEVSENLYLEVDEKNHSIVEGTTISIIYPVTLN